MLDNTTTTVQDGNSDKIDKQSYQPAYLQLANILKDKIVRGVFRPDEQLPSESELRAQYNISQMTIRRAIGLLQDQGIVDTSQGKGSFVKPIKIDMATFQLTSLLDLFSDKHTEIKLLEADLVFPDKQTQKALSVSKDDRVVYLFRLISRKNVPVLLHKEFLVYDPTRPLVESEMEVTTLGGLLSGNDHKEFKKGEMSLATTTVKTEESNLLNIPEKSDVFLIEHIFYDFQDMVVSLGRFLCRSDIITFKAKVGLW